MSKPITPYEVSGKKCIPDEVFDAFNKLIAQNFAGGEAVVKQDDVVAEILRTYSFAEMGRSNPAQRREFIFAQHWLDVEDLYRRHGWDVEFDKPGYNESGDAMFTFKPKKKGR